MFVDRFKAMLEIFSKNYAYDVSATTIENCLAFGLGILYFASGATRKRFLQIRFSASPRRVVKIC